MKQDSDVVPLYINPSPKIKLFRSWRQLNDSYLVGSMVLLGLLLRLPSLKLGLWRDEASTYFDALPSSFKELLATVSHSELNPPGFYLVMQQWMRWFGTEELVLKLPALSFGLLLIVATYALGRVVSSRATGLLAALFTTTATQAVYNSQEARPYSLTALLCCLSVLLYCQALNCKRQTQYLLGFVLCATTLLYVQYTGLLLVGSLAAVTVYLLWRREPGLRLFPFALAFGAIFLLFVPWLPIFLTHLHTGTPWISKAPWWQFPNQIIDDLSYTVPGVRPLRKFFLVLLIGIGIGQVFYSQRHLRIAPMPAPILTLGTTLGLVATGQAFLFSGASFVDRYMFPFAPIAWVFYSHWGVALWQYFTRHWHRRRDRSSIRAALVCATLCGLLVLPNVVYALSKNSAAKSGVRALVADIQRMHLEKTVYVVAPDSLGPTFGYYATQMQLSAPFYGFARWEHPELFSPQDYAQIWQAPAAVPDAERRIQNLTKQGYSQLAFVTSPSNQDAGAIPFSKTDRLLIKLRQTYPLRLTREYPGANESASLYLFTLSPTHN